MKDTFYDLMYVIWFVYVTVMCITGFIDNPSVVNFLIALSVWMIMLAIPGVLRGK